jgi:hypothetical protein
MLSIRKALNGGSLFPNYVLTGNSGCQAADVWVLLNPETESRPSYASEDLTGVERSHKVRVK